MNMLQELSQRPLEGGLNTINSSYESHILNNEGSATSIEKSEMNNKDLHDQDTEQAEAIESYIALEKALRVELKDSKHDLKKSRKAYVKARGLYEDSVSPYGTYQDLAPATAHARIGALRKSLSRCQDALEDHSEQVRDLRDQIRRVSDLVKLERTKVSRANSSRLHNQGVLRRPLASGYQLNTIDPTSDSAYLSADADTSRSSRNSPVSPTQVHDSLFDKYSRSAADVGIYGERLADFNYEYWSAVAEREIRQDQEETLSLSDEDFERQWQTEREGITRKLEQAIQDADKLRDACRLQGFDMGVSSYDNWDRAPLPATPIASGDEAGHSQAIEYALAEIPSAVFEDAEVVHASPSEDDSDPPRQLKDPLGVRSWMDSI